MFSMNSVEIFLNLFILLSDFWEKQKPTLNCMDPVVKASVLHILITVAVSVGYSMAGAGCVSLGCDFNQELKALVKKQSCQNGLV